MSIILTVIISVIGGGLVGWMGHALYTADSVYDDADFWYDWDGK